MPIFILRIFIFLPIILNISCTTTTIDSNGNRYLNSIDNQKLFDVNIKLAIEYQTLDLDKIALLHIKESIKLDSKNYKPYLLLGIHFEKNGDLGLAFQNLTIAKKLSKSLDQNMLELDSVYARIACKNHQFSLAIDQFNTIIANNSHDHRIPIILFNRGNCYYNNAKYDLAEASYLESYGYDQIPIELYMALAKVQFVQGKHIDSIKNITNYLSYLRPIHKQNQPLIDPKYQKLINNQQEVKKKYKSAISLYKANLKKISVNIAHNNEKIKKITKDKDSLKRFRDTIIKQKIELNNLSRELDKIEKINVYN